MLGEIFEPFVNESPVSVMARGLAERILQPERLDAWFEGLDTPQYTRDLLFSSVFNLMSQYGAIAIDETQILAGVLSL